MDSKQFGKHGEGLAADFLKKEGYEILGRNYRKRGGEIDIIAFDPSHREIVFVEVKSRRNRAFGGPEEAISDQKIRKMAETAELWLSENGKEKEEWRVDLIGIESSRHGKYEIAHWTNIS
ncbi:YraN family protein [Candidatus Peregrinibacteria bacterium]|nr:YraN family protein [Candidatus Peregrinibacteria bacterium]